MQVFTLRFELKMNNFHYKQPFLLESGKILPEITISYHTYGQLNDKKDNVIWVCHALTANSEAAEWWPGVIGKDCAINPDKYFIVCANILGSCYGSTGPLSINPVTGQPYYNDFPAITIRDMVKAHQLLFNHLEIADIHLLMGGSMGGYQALEWSIMEPSKINLLFIIATSAKETAWGIAIHTAQRLAIEADCTFNQSSRESGQKGLKAARAIGMLTYRGYNSFMATQNDTDFNKTDHFRVSSYIEHQGNKLVKRFNAYSYWFLTKAMDSHNIARNRTNTLEEALKIIKQKTLIIGVNTDILCPLTELQFLAAYIPDNNFYSIDSIYGHDGFLVESKTINNYLLSWLNH
ncbi:MAG TPA: homoserine O-acetyltransferase [Flavisolibacter sp.]|nr:homoserine O-acetyltransferase [Flavisolibacter sp.]